MTNHKHPISHFIQLLSQPLPTVATTVITMTHHHNGNSHHSSCCCNPLTCCCACIFDCLCHCIYQIICVIFVILALIAVVSFIFFRPTPIKLHITNAMLTQLDISSNDHNLYYNLAMNLTIRNPNKRLGLYYDSIDLKATYKGQKFAFTSLQPFYQKTKNTAILDNIVLRGQSMLLGDQKGPSRHGKDTSFKLYNIDVDIYLRVRFKALLFKTSHFKPKFHCDLKVPLSVDANRTSPSGTTCHLAWHRW